jgi:DNA primase
MESFTPREISAFYAARLPGLKQRGKQWRCPCPIHKGERDSFAVEAETGRAFCHSTCHRGWDIISLQRELTGKSFQAARSEVFHLVGRPEGNDRKALGFRVEAEYSYTDETGRLSFVVERRRLSDGKKTFKG